MGQIAANSDPHSGISGVRNGLLLVGAVVLVAVPTAVVAYWLVGVNGVWATLLAAAVCVGSGAVALVLQMLFRDPKFMLAHVLAGFMFRMGVPLLVCFFLYGIKSPLAEAGFVFCLMPVYGAVLVVETLVLVSNSPGNAKKIV